MPTARMRSSKDQMLTSTLCGPSRWVKTLEQKLAPDGGAQQKQAYARQTIRECGVRASRTSRLSIAAWIRGTGRRKTSGFQMMTNLPESNLWRTTIVVEFYTPTLDQSRSPER